MIKLMFYIDRRGASVLAEPERKKNIMNKLFSILLRVIISLIFSGLILAGALAAFQFFDPTFSLGMFDMLALRSLPAWLLLGLTTAIGYALLSRLPAQAGNGSGGGRKQEDDDQQSD